MEYVVKFSADTGSLVGELRQTANQINQDRAAQEKANQSMQRMEKKLADLNRDARREAFAKLPIEEQLTQLYQRREQIAKRLAQAQGNDKRTTALKVAVGLNDKDIGRATKEKDRQDSIQAQKDELALQAKKQAAQNRLTAQSQQLTQLARQQRDQRFAELTTEEKIEKLEERRAKLQQLMAKANTEWRRNQLQIGQRQNELSLSQLRVPKENPLAAGLKELGMRFTAFASVGFLVDKAAEKVSELIQEARRIAESSRRAGISSESYQSFSTAGRPSGIGEEDIATSFKFLRRNIGQATSGGANNSQLKMFERFGISLNELKTSSPEAIFLKIGAAIEKSGGSAKQFEDSLSLLGRSGDKFFAAFIDGFVQTAQKIKAAGGVIDNDTVEQLAEAADKAELFGKIVQSTWAPSIAFVAGKLTDVYIIAKKLGNLTVPAAFARFLGVLSVGGSLKEATASAKDGGKSENQELDEKRKAAEEEAARRAAARKNKKPTTDVDELNKRKEQEETLKAMKEKAAFDAMTHAQKLLELKRQELALQKQMDATNDPNEKLALEIKKWAIIDKENEESKHAGEEGKSKGRHEKANADRLAKVGLFKGNTDRDHSIQQQQLRVMAQQREDVGKLKATLQIIYTELRSGVVVNLK